MTNRLSCSVAGLIAVCGLSGTALADAASVELAPPFAGQPVLQRDAPVPIWGRGTPGDRIEVRLAKVSAETVVAADGSWVLELAPQPAADAARLTVSSNGTEAIVRDNIAIGDVWLCSGQSNMEFELRKANNGESEVAASADPGLRLLLVKRQRAFEPTHLPNGSSWKVSGADSSADFSAACYYMGREFRRHLKVPIGLIAASWGGSRIEDWLSREQAIAIPALASPLAAQEQFLRQRAVGPAAPARGLREWVSARLALRRPVWRNAAMLSVNWEEWGASDLVNFDGVASYQLEFDLDAYTAVRARRLVLGRIDDADWTSINGRNIGSSRQWDALRDYPLESGVLRAGRNRIDVTVLDTGGGGGFWGTEGPTLIMDDGSRLPLRDGWQFAPRISLAEAGQPPDFPWERGEGPTTLHNGMIAPLGGYRIKGFAWYQGESNAAEAEGYPVRLSALIVDWQRRFGGQDFLIVQLAGYGQLTGGVQHSNWAELREAQRLVALRIPGAKLVPAIDIGDRFDIHPVNKKELGRRLALAAMAPQWRLGTGISASRSGSSVTILLGGNFRRFGGSAGPIGFELCGRNKECRLVTVLQPMDDRIVVKAEPDDTELRYLWSNSPLVGLYDPAGIPLPPFRIELP